MKRVFGLILAIAVGVILSAPLSLGGPKLVMENVANAADPFATECIPTKKDPCNCPKGQVEIALPVIGNGHCISNDKNTGGAVINYLRLILRVLSGLVGGVIVLMLVISGIQYITSAGDPAALKSAKNRIVGAITALLLFVLMFAILNFLLPGGLT